MPRLRTALVVILVAIGACSTSGQPERAAPEAGATSTTAEPAEAATSDTTGPAVPAPPQVLSLTLEDYAVAPSESSLASGEVVLQVLNHDAAPHNLAVIATERSVDDLPTVGIRVDETSGDLAIIGRVETLANHERGDVRLTLSAGTYVLVCTVPHHYVRNSMAATLVVS